MIMVIMIIMKIITPIRMTVNWMMMMRKDGGNDDDYQDDDVD
jgi:hypothetical protein